MDLGSDVLWRVIMLRCACRDGYEHDPRQLTNNCQCVACKTEETYPSDQWLLFWTSTGVSKWWEGGCLALVGFGLSRFAGYHTPYSYIVLLRGMAGRRIACVYKCYMIRHVFSFSLGNYSFTTGSCFIFHPSWLCFSVPWMRVAGDVA